VAAACAVIAGAWIAAGSVGLMGHALRHALTWLAVVVAIVCAWQKIERRAPLLAGAIAALVAAAFMLSSTNPATNVFAVAVVGLALAGVVNEPQGRNALR
jgi:hypothetical protein